MGLVQIDSVLKGWIHPLSRLLCRIASGLLFAMMGLTVADILLRILSGRSILGTVELTELMLLVIAFFALAHTEVSGGHIKVELIVGRFNERTRRILDGLTQLACFLLFVVITGSILKYAVAMHRSGEVTQDLRAPIYPFVYLVALGCAVLTLALFLKFLEALSGRRES